MSWSEFISSVISSTAWPIAVVVIVVLFRKSIIKLIPDLHQLKYGNLELQFDKNLEALSEEAKQILPSKTQQTSDEGEPSQPEHALRSLASVSPRACFVETWRVLESKTKSALDRLGISLRHKGSASEIFTVLETKTNLDSRKLGLMRRMIHLRNQAAHSDYLHISESEANQYVDIAMEIINAIDSLDHATSAKS